MRAPRPKAEPRTAEGHSALRRTARCPSSPRRKGAGADSGDWGVYELANLNVEGTYWPVGVYVP